MRAAKFAMLVLAVVLAGCTKPLDRKIDASSEKAYKESLASIEAGLSPDEKTRFDKALAVVALSSAIPKEGGLLGLLAAAKDPSALQTKVLGAVNGKTPRQVIAQADTVMKERAKAELSSVEEEIADLEKKKAGAEKTQGVLSAITVTSPRFYWSGSSFPEPVLDFKVTNGAGVALSRIYFHGTVSTPGRTIPWVDEDFNYEVAGGLEKGETRHLQLSPNLFSKWGTRETQGRKDLVFTVHVVNAEGPDEKKLVQTFGKDDAARLAELLKKKAELEQTLAQH